MDVRSGCWLRHVDEGVLQLAARLRLLRQPRPDEVLAARSVRRRSGRRWGELLEVRGLAGGVLIARGGSGGGECEWGYECLYLLCIQEAMNSYASSILIKVSLALERTWLLIDPPMYSISICPGF